MNFSFIIFFYYIDFAVIIGRYFFSCPCIFNDDIHLVFLKLLMDFWNSSVSSTQL